MASPEDAAALREMWTASNGRLRDLEGEWIAFRNGEIQEHSPSLEDLLGIYAEDIARRESPIFAFVRFGGIQ